MTYTLRSNRTTNHIEGIGAKTLAADVTEDVNSARGYVAYSAENACGVLTRNATRMSRDKSYETLSEALEAARKAGGRKLCKTCEKAAQAELDALVAVVAELEPVAEVAAEADLPNLATHTGTVHAKGRYSKSLRGPMPKCCLSGSAVSRFHYVIPTADPVTCKRCLAATPEETPVSEPRRAKLRLTNAHMMLSESGELVIIADDAVRGPVEIALDETNSRWLRACFADMPPLNHDDE